jgi:hypothetical protein
VQVELHVCGVSVVQAQLVAASSCARDEQDVLTIVVDWFHGWIWMYRWWIYPVATVPMWCGLLANAIYDAQIGFGVFFYVKTGRLFLYCLGIIFEKKSQGR